MSECYKTSDNKYSDCPPRMSDGRHFTDYRPSNQLELLVAADNSAHNSFQYRQFLQHNGKELMGMNRQVAVRNNGCSNCATAKQGVEGFDNGTMLPEKYMQTCDANGCNVKLNFAGGVGTGRQYYTTAEQADLPSQSVPYTENDCMGDAKYAKYGDDTSMLARHCTPLGGNPQEHKMN